MFSSISPSTKMCSEYEKLRLKNLADNRRVLAELGIRHSLEKFQVVHKPIKRKSLWTPKATKRFSVSSTSEEGSIAIGVVRRSCRLRGEKPSENNFIQFSDDVKESPTKRVPQFRQNTFGSIDGVEVGTWWPSRVNCSYAGIHRPTVAGIHGSETEGAYSIALSGGYEDDLDFGECFTYTGEGGRDLRGTKTNPKNLRTAPQSKDQTLTRGNLAISRNCELGRPIRVIRGFKSKSDFAPEEGYRYDGLYTVEKYWYTVGLSGFGVWKFALQRCPDQAPPPWTVKNQDAFSDKANEESDADSGVDSLDSDTASQHSNSSNSSSSGGRVSNLVKKDNSAAVDSPAEENDSDGDGISKCSQIVENDSNGEDFNNV